MVFLPVEKSDGGGDEKRGNAEKEDDGAMQRGTKEKKGENGVDMDE